MNRFIMIAGLPGSGKSTVARELAEVNNAALHSSDDLREELFRDANNQDMNDVVFKELTNRVLRDLKNGRNVVYDATNISFKKRKAFLERLDVDCFKECVLVATPYETCLIRNSSRLRKVPEDVIEKMYRGIFIPQYYEGWDHIDIIFNSEGTYEIDEFMKDLDTIDQENSYHTLTIGEHCKRCMENMKMKSSDESLVTAALLHDIGKKFTKAYKDLKGIPTVEAHYYGHQNVSAYLSLFYLKHLPIEKLLEITNYIQWHMRPFDLHSAKSKLKAVKLFGQKFYDNLLLLHEADTMAK